MTSIKPYKIAIPQKQIDDLYRRLETAIFPSEVEHAAWNYGPTRSYIEKMMHHLQHDFDWRKAEAAINKLPQFITEIDGQKIHFLHVQSDRKDATPLLLIHGWPGSIIEFLDVVEPLVNPADDQPAFHVVIPSLPGFGFSGPTTKPGWNNDHIAKAFISIMDDLGYASFGVQGGDAGAIIGPEIARLAPKKVIGVHVNAATMGFIPMGPIDPNDLATFTDAEKIRAQRLQQFMAEHFGFNAIQSSRPQALAYGISDSPVGLLAWICELFESFGDRIGAVDYDKFLTNFAIYWFTNTAASSMRLYYENMHDPNAWAPKQNSGVPTAVAVFGFDEVPIRRYGEQGNTIVRWTEFDKGGHYAVLEEPDLWLGDVRAFFESL